MPGYWKVPISTLITLFHISTAVGLIINTSSDISSHYQDRTSTYPEETKDSRTLESQTTVRSVDIEGSTSNNISAASNPSLQPKSIQSLLSQVMLASSSSEDNKANITGQEILETLLTTRWDVFFRQLLSHDSLDVLFPRPGAMTPACYMNILDVIGGLLGVNVPVGNFVQDRWALEMLDATGKPAAGILQGVFQWVGNYEECLNVRARVATPSNYSGYSWSARPVQFEGRYCRVLLPVGHLVNVSFPDDINDFWRHQQTFPVAINWGVCVPSSCRAEDVVSFFTQGKLAALNLPVRKAVCFEAPRFGEDIGALITVVVLCTCLAVVIVCTVLDVYYYRPWVESDATKREVSKNKEEIADGKIEMGICPSDITLQVDIPSKEQAADNGVVSKEQTADNGVVSKEQTADNGVGSKEQTADNGVGSKERKVSQSSRPSSVKVWFNALIAWLIRNNTSPKETVRKQKEDHLEPEKHITSIVGLETNKPHNDTKITNKPHNDTKTTTTENSRAGVDNPKNRAVGAQIIQGLSLYRNLCALLRESRSQGTFNCIQGMRVISLAWIVVGHCYTYGGMLEESNLIFGNSAELVTTSARLSFHLVGSANLAVDTFFVISGCLTMLVTLRLLRRNKPGLRFWSTFWFHRFWRLTPMYMVVLMVGTNLYEYLVQGPLKSEQLAEFNQCRRKWWAHLLYINNFYKPFSKCMTWSWFMAVDMQLFVTSPLFIYNVHRNKKVGVGLILGLLVLGVVGAFISEFVHGGQFLLMDINFQEYWSYVYTMPWARASVFAIGLLLGVVMYQHSGRSLLSKRKSLCVWLLVAALAVFLALVNHNQWKEGSQHWTRLQQSFYESLVRPAWALCIAWVILACCSDMGGYANVILAWRPFQVLSRLTYSLYLLHPMIIMFVVYNRRTTIYLDPGNLSLVYIYIGNLTLSFLLGAVFSLVFEMPMTAMENILWRSHQ